MELEIRFSRATSSLNQTIPTRREPGDEVDKLLKTIHAYIVQAQVYQCLTLIDDQPQLKLPIFHHVDSTSKI